MRGAAAESCDMRLVLKGSLDQYLARIASLEACCHSVLPPAMPFESQLAYLRKSRQAVKNRSSTKGELGVNVHVIICLSLACTTYQYTG